VWGGRGDQKTGLDGKRGCGRTGRGTIEVLKCILGLWVEGSLFSGGVLCWV
jgi:hypothetical protein